LIGSNVIPAVLFYIFLGYIFVSVSHDKLFLIQASPIYAISILSITAVGALSLVYYFKNNKANRLKTFYTFISLSIMFYVLAEISWAWLESLHINPYMNIPDVFYALYFIFGIRACISLFWCRIQLIPKYYKIIPAIITLLGLLSYVLLSLEQYGTTTFWFGFMMMILSASLLGCATLATLTVRKAPKLGLIGSLFGIAFLANSLGDIFYYAAENTGSYVITDWYNIVWAGTPLILIYAMIRHRFLYGEEDAGKTKQKKNKK